MWHIKHPLSLPKSVTERNQENVITETQLNLRIQSQKGLIKDVNHRVLQPGFLVYAHTNQTPGDANSTSDWDTDLFTVSYYFF